MHLICLPKFRITFVFRFSWVSYSRPKRNGKEAYAKLLGGKLKVHYGSRASAVNERNGHLEIFLLSSINRKF